MTDASRKPLAQQEGYLLANVSGELCQCPNNITRLEGGYGIAPFNPDVRVAANYYLPSIPELEQKAFAMKNARNAFRNLEVTPNPFTAASVKPETERRYTVLPTPAIGLLGVTKYNEL